EPAAPGPRGGAAGTAPARGPRPRSLVPRRFLDGMLQQLADEAVGGDPIGLSLELQEDAMPQRWSGDGVEVVEGDVVAAFEQSPDLGAQHHRLHAARAGAP